MMNVVDALRQLDVSNDDLWTANGLPKMAVMIDLTGEDTLTRNKVTKAAPQYTRDNPILPGSEIEPEEVEAEEGVYELREKLERAAKEEGVYELREKLERAAKDVELIRAEKLVAEKKLADAEEEYDTLADQLNVAAPNPSNQEAIISYIKAQQEQRELRHQRRAFVLENIGPDVIQPKSKLDQAFAAKRGRGNQRPVRKVTQ